MSLIPDETEAYYRHGKEAERLLAEQGELERLRTLSIFARHLPPRVRGNCRYRWRGRHLRLSAGAARLPGAPGRPGGASPGASARSGCEIRCRVGIHHPRRCPQAGSPFEESRCSLIARALVSSGRACGPSSVSSRGTQNPQARRGPLRRWNFSFCLID
jgi:hypothetical protein